MSKFTDWLLPAKKQTEDEQWDIVVNNPAEENFLPEIDQDSFHSLFPFSWEQYPTYVQSGENYMRSCWLSKASIWKLVIRIEAQKRRYQYRSDNRQRLKHQHGVLLQKDHTE